MSISFSLPLCLNPSEESKAPLSPPVTNYVESSDKKCKCGPAVCRWEMPCKPLYAHERCHSGPCVQMRDPRQVPVCTWEMPCRPPALKSRLGGWGEHSLFLWFFFSWLLEAASGLWALVPAFSREDVRVMYVISSIGPRTLDQAPVFACWTAEQDKLTCPVGHLVFSTQPGIQEVSEVFAS